MTEPASTEIVGAARRLASAPGASIGSLLKGLTNVGAARRTPVVTLPKGVAITTDQRVALARFADLAEKALLPDARRELTEAERASLDELLGVMIAVEDLIKPVKDDLRAAYFNDQDVRAEAAGEVSDATPRDKGGFYLVQMDGEASPFQRVLTAGTPSADVEALHDLEVEGSIEHADYLMATRPVRVIDEAGFLKLVRTKPQLMGVLRRAVKFSRQASISFKIR